MRRLVFGLIALGACSPEVDSPAPQVTNIQPNVTCNAQLTKPIQIMGANLTPLPTKTLGGEVLVLPQVSLTQTQSLAGMAQGGAPLVIADPHVRWESESLMTFDFTPDLNAKEGIYDLTVTNPDGQAASLPGGLAVVSPPSITMLVPPSLCDAESDQTLTLKGTGFLTIAGKGPTVDVLDSGGNVVFSMQAVPSDCTAVGSRNPALQLCMTLTITIPAGTLAAGTYGVRVTNPADAECRSTETVTFTVEPPPVVDMVVPSTICAGGGTLHVHGMNFRATPMVELRASGQATLSGNVSNFASDGTSFDATFGGGANVGTSYDLVVTNPDGCSDAPPHKQITINPGPLIYLADPEVVYNGVNMRVTIYLTVASANIPANGVWIVPAGQIMPVTTITWTPVAGHPNRLQVTIPSGQTPGTYDLYVRDNTGCPAILPMALTVTHDTFITLKNVLPPFGWTGSDTAITIFRDSAAPAPGNVAFMPTPRAFLNPHNPQPTDVAIPLSSVAFGDASALTAVVPAGQPAKTYDLIVTNPDGSVGFLPSAFTVTDTTHPPPQITTVVPSSIVDATGQNVTIFGQNFRSNGTVVLSLACEDPSGTITTVVPTAGALTCTTQCSLPATINAGALPVGSVCVLTLTNDDGTYTSYSAIGVTNSSLNLPAPKPGTAMNTGRRALVASSGDATSAARFVYAIGGDSGVTSMPLDSTEFAPVDPFGAMGGWTTQRYALPAARTLMGSAKMGRYTYVFGGSDGTAAQSTAWRAMILDPSEAPVLDVDDLILSDTGLDSGYWFYRVSAAFAAGDPDNPGGESLASDEFIVRLPALAGKKIKVQLTWSAPPVGMVAGYRIYRTAAAGGSSGGEVLVGTVTGTATTFTDDGSGTPGTETPLPLGSMGQWAALPNMGTARQGAAGAAAFDPANPSVFYVYALLGESSATTALGSYEFLRVQVGANGHQTAGVAWTPGTAASAQPRWQLGAWVVNGAVSSLYNAATYVFVGGGLTAANGGAGKVEAGQVLTGGQLASLDDTPRDFSSNVAGYGVAAANGELFAFGGANGTPSSNAKSASLVAPPPTLANNAWNSEGIALSHGRYLMGSTVQNAFIFLVGGQTDEPSPASSTTELVIW